MKKRLLSLVLCLVMVFSLFPAFGMNAAATTAGSAFLAENKLKAEWTSTDGGDSSGSVSASGTSLSAVLAARNNTTTIKLINNTDEPQNLSFTYSARVARGSVTIDGAEIFSDNSSSSTTTNGNYPGTKNWSGTLVAGDSGYISITLARNGTPVSDTNNYTYLDLTDITLTPNKTSSTLTLNMSGEGHNLFMAEESTDSTSVSVTGVNCTPNSTVASSDPSVAEATVAADGTIAITTHAVTEVKKVTFTVSGTATDPATYSDPTSVTFTVTVAPDPEHVKAYDPESGNITMTVTGKDLTSSYIETETVAKAVNLCLVVDVSGSLSDHKTELDNAIDGLLNSVSADSKIGLVTYSTSANDGVIITKDQFDGITIESSNVSDMTSGIRKGVALLNSDAWQATGNDSVMIIISDGRVSQIGYDTTVNGRHYNAAIHEARAAKQSGIKIYTINVEMETVYPIVYQYKYPGSDDQSKAFWLLDTTTWNANGGMAALEAISSNYPNGYFKKLTQAECPGYYDKNAYAAVYNERNDDGVEYAYGLSNDNWDEIFNEIKQNEMSSLAHTTGVTITDVLSDAVVLNGTPTVTLTNGTDADFTSSTAVVNTSGKTVTANFGTYELKDGATYTLTIPVKPAAGLSTGTYDTNDSGTLTFQYGSSDPDTVDYNKPTFEAVTTVIDYNYPVKLVESLDATASRWFNGEKNANSTVPGKSGTYTVSGTTVTYQLSTAVLNPDDGGSISNVTIKAYGGVDSAMLKDANGWKLYSSLPATSVYYDDDLTAPQSTSDITGVGYNANVSTSADRVDLANAAGEATGGKVINYTFTGTGIDVYSTTTVNSSMVVAQLTDSTGEVHKLSMNNTSAVERYNVPSIFFHDLPYGTHTLKIYALKGANYQLDGIRVYNPAGISENYKGNANTAEANAIYAAENLSEQNATFANLHELLIEKAAAFTQADGTTALTFFTDKETGKNSTEYVVDQDGNKQKVEYEPNSLGAYKIDGPKNELYLEPSQGIAFTIQNWPQLKAAHPHLKLMVGLSAPNSATSDVSVTLTDGDTTRDQDIKSAMDMYYEVVPSSTGHVMIQNEDAALIALTNFKVSGASVPIKIEFSGDQISAATVLSLAENDPAAQSEEVLDTMLLTVNDDTATYVERFNALSTIYEIENGAATEPGDDPTEDPSPEPTQEPTIQDLIKTIVSSFVKALFKSISRLFGN